MQSIEEKARALAQEIQLSPVYTAWVAARECNESDDALCEQMRELELLRMQYQRENAKGEAADSARMDAYNQRFQAVYDDIAQNPNMQAYQTCAEALEAMMKRVTGILKGAANGEDPATYEPESGCGGGCCGGHSHGHSGCGGCHS
ncbi:MAG: YlbF family regulator [Oscillospiraceae bacterium]|jgi:cell fate (sporulation/competence/biofilm development) regulator YlbF (YheA/YmcA/DUF963 family)|nr:YlbF family regulator [Oscillospiraceae bacterium]